MNKIISLVSTSLLLATTQTFANRPAMDERESAPVAAPAAIAVPAPVEHVQTVVEQHTTTALQVQPGQTMPVRLLDFPRRGMTMNKVKNELGQPNAVNPAVGQPPITTWIYGDRNVYFEHSYVVHAVATR